MTETEKSVTVVIADDHVLVRKGTRQLLEEHPGLSVVGEAADGKEAIEVTTRLKPDVVLMDIAMPGTNGIEATRRIKETSPSTSVLVLTAYDDEQYIYALLDAGAAGYLLKNVSGEELARSVYAVAAGESVLHPSVAAKVFKRVTSGGGGRAEAGDVDQLTERELAVLRLAAGGLSNKMIARDLDLSDRTVQVHLSNVFGKLRAASRTEAVITALRQGIVRLEDIS